MSGWTADELDTIDAADEIDIAALRPDGSLSPFRIIWVVRAGDDLYVRSVLGRDSAWFRAVLRRPEGCIRGVGVEHEVAFEEPADADHDAIDEAYRRKYARYDRVDVDAIVDPTARVATLRLLPHRDTAEASGTSDGSAVQRTNSTTNNMSKSGSPRSNHVP
jgi:hypothetical protein